MRTSHAGRHDDSLPLVDLIACAICSVLLLVFAALTSQGGLDGSPNAFVLVVMTWEFPDGTDGVSANVMLDSRNLVSLEGGRIRPSADWFPDQSDRPGSSWTTPEAAIPSVTLMADPPTKAAKKWVVRLLLRQQGHPLSGALVCSFRGGKQPASFDATYTDQSLKGQETKQSLQFNRSEPVAVRIDFDIGTVTVSQVVP